MSVYPKTATKSKSGKKVYAFGRETALDGLPIERGGYRVYGLSENYDGQVRGGIRKSWGLVEQNLTYAEVVTLMNKKCGYEAFKPK